MHLCNERTVCKLVMLGSKVLVQLACPTCIQNNLFLRVMTSPLPFLHSCRQVDNRILLLLKPSHGCEGGIVPVVAENRVNRFFRFFGSWVPLLSHTCSLYGCFVAFVCFPPNVLVTLMRRLLRVAVFFLFFSFCIIARCAVSFFYEVVWCAGWWCGCRCSPPRSLFELCTRGVFLTCASTHVN